MSVCVCVCVCYVCLCVYVCVCVCVCVCEKRGGGNIFKGRLPHGSMAEPLN